MTKFFQITSVLFCLITALSVSCADQGQDKAPQPPNIIVILADDQRADYLGCAGHSVVRTPNIDSLSEHGTYFRNAFVTTAACTPSRTSILTGEYERSHGITFGSVSALTEGAFSRTYPMLLKQAGYYTGYVGKNHTPVGQSDQGSGYSSGYMEKAFDYWYGNHGHSTFYPKDHHPIYQGAGPDTQVEIFETGTLNFLKENPEFAAANDFLDTRPADKPFCLLVNFNVPHGAGTGTMKLRPEDPELYRMAYRDRMDELPLPGTYVAEKDKTPKIPLHVYSGEYIRQYVYVKTPESLRERQVKTCQTVTGIDNLVGSVVTRLQDLDIEDNTIIVYMSDHGLQHGEHGLGGKVLAYEESMRVPMIIYDPRIPRTKRGKECGALVLNIDITPTILELAGQGIPGSMQGKSLVPLLNNRKTDWRKDFFFENMFMGQNYPRLEAVRTQDWKYIRYYSKEKDQHHILSLVAPLLGEQPVYEELYQLEADPEEMQNLAGVEEFREVLDRFRKRCDELLAEAKGDNDLPDTYIEEFKDSAFRQAVLKVYRDLDSKSFR